MEAFCSTIQILSMHTPTRLYLFKRLISFLSIPNEMGMTSLRKLRSWFAMGLFNLNPAPLRISKAKRRKQFLAYVSWALHLDCHAWLVHTSAEFDYLLQKPCSLGFQEPVLLGSHVFPIEKVKGTKSKFTLVANIQMISSLSNEKLLNLTTY